MGQDRGIAVISDIHIGEGQLDDFDAELEGHFCTFLKHLGDCSSPMELVVNGDFLDFVQATPWAGKDLEASTSDGVPLCFTENQSLAKLEAIVGAHPSVFEHLKAFLLAKPKNRLVILPGNHDADFFWPRVRDKFVSSVGAKPGDVVFQLDDHYVPEGYQWLWIEHGHQYDPVNNFIVRGHAHWSSKLPPIFESESGETRLYECTGTRFLIKFLNSLDARYPFVDNVKPFSRFLRIFGTSILTPGYGPLDAVVAVGAMLKYMATIGIAHRADLMSAKSPEGGKLRDLVKRILRSDRKIADQLVKDLAQRQIKLGMPLDMILTRPVEADKLLSILGDNLDLLARFESPNPTLLGLTTGKGTLTLKEGYSVDETDELIKSAKRVASCSVTITTIAMGHTHESVFKASRHTYFNTGCWTRYYRFDDQAPTRAWKVLRENSFEQFPYHLRYVYVPANCSGASMETWKERAGA